ncbi:MAG: hypothetical protein DI551_03935 [Micavibrio aeruginosavorus]|uniref:Uncharacterized protein n=1 Tax=Micavibrio aeruginosavorus TaxID=349221 RepID=A0A2W5N0M5_9BACT|nr:MAG: hypothetical protein DI551_03935 [Micavibrio aeruginosavorus]
MLGGAAAAGTAACGMLHWENPEDIPPLDPKTHRITLGALDLSAPANILNAKHLFLRFESGPLRKRWDVHGLATNRETDEIRNVGVPTTDDIRVHAMISDANDKGEFQDDQEFGGILKSVHMLMSTEDAGKFFNTYLWALRAGIEINKLHLPYYPLSLDMIPTNSNAVARTMLETCGFDFPGRFDGIAPGKDSNLLHRNNIFPSKPPVVANTLQGLRPLGLEIGEAETLLNRSRSNEGRERPSSFLFERYGTSLDLKALGYLHDQGLPRHALTVDYMHQMEVYDYVLSGGYGRPPSYEYVTDKHAEIYRLRDEIQKELGVSMPLSKRLLEEARRSAYNPDGSLRL